MTKEDNKFIPTPEGLKAIYEHHGRTMEMIFDSIFHRDEWEPALNAILPPEKAEKEEVEN